MSRRTDIRTALQATLATVAGVKSVYIKRRFKGQAPLPALVLVDDSETLDEMTLSRKNSAYRFTVVAAVTRGTDDSALAQLDDIVDAVITAIHAAPTLGLSSSWAIRAMVTQVDIEHDLSEEGAAEATITITVDHRRA